MGEDSREAEYIYRRYAELMWVQKGLGDGLVTELWLPISLA